MPLPPTGTVTFLFTDIEGSTRLWEAHPEAMRPALTRHDTLLRGSIERHGGFVFKTIGDAFCAAFPTAQAALDAALSAQQSLVAEPWELPAPLAVRMALHTGTCDERGGDYFGPPVNRVARLMSAGHGGQTLLSLATQELTRDTLPAGAALRDLGAHRLKDLARPEQVFEVLHPALPAGFPPLRSLDNPDLLHNLPQQVSSFIGRERETAQVRALAEKSRLLTLTGAGGSGKTRLALQVAADLLDGNGDGVWLVELAAITDPALVTQAVAQVLGVREETGRPLQRTLLDWLKAKRLLLVLDNCEHLVSAVASLAAEGLRSCPEIGILATSREPLGVAGEQIYRVPSLSLPNPRQAQTALSLSQFEAVRLFIERARAVQPGFEVSNANAPAVAQVCWQLDGIPLAIELAAARVRTLTVEQIGARLDNRFRLLTGGARDTLPRQQTLRALVDWSYDLLTASEKTLLRRLSVFAGGWTLPAAETVGAGQEGANEDIEDWEVLDLLTSLADKSLVVYEDNAAIGGRYRLLETIREYAGEHLAQSGEAESVRSRHLEDAERGLGRVWPQDRPDLADWLRRVEGEHDNLRAALDWGLTLAPGDPKIAVRVIRMTRFLWVYWNTRALFREGSRYALAALDANADARQTVWGNMGLIEAAVLLSHEDPAASFVLCDERVAWCRAQGNDDGLIHAIFNFMGLHVLAGDFGGAAARGEQALAEIVRARAAGSVPEKMLRRYGYVVLLNLAEALDAQERYSEALTRAQEAAALFPAEGFKDWVAENQVQMGVILLRPWPGRDAEAADAHLRSGLALFADLGSREGIAAGLFGLGLAARERGDWVRFALLLGAAAGLRRRHDLVLTTKEQGHEDSRDAARDVLGEEAFAAAWASGEAMTLEQAVASALAEA